MKREYEWRGRRYEARLEQLGDRRYRLLVGDQETVFSARPLADGGWLIGQGAKWQRAYARADGDLREVWLAGRRYRLRRIERRLETAGSASQGTGSLRAEMPCQVVRIMAAAGETVAAGAPLLLMEAMKMELRLDAPAAGRVLEWLVSEGEVVARGGELLRFEASEDSALSSSSAASR